MEIAIEYKRGKEMEHSTFYTESQIGNGYDILCIHSKKKKYSLFLNYKDYDVNPYGEWPILISREEFA